MNSASSVDTSRVHTSSRSARPAIAMPSSTRSSPGVGRGTAEATGSVAPGCGTGAVRLVPADIGSGAILHRDQIEARDGDRAPGGVRVVLDRQPHHVALQPGEVPADGDADL